MVFKNILLALERIERRQRLILDRLKGLEISSVDAADKWLQSGIDNILSYQAGKKGDDGR